MGHANWDAALVIRANELLEEVRRYHVDAEATRLQLATAAASITRKVDELPATVRRLVEESLQQDTFNAERPIIARKLDLSTRMLNDLAAQLQGSGMQFLRHARLTSTAILIVSALAGMAMAFWTATSVAEAARLTTQISTLRQTVTQLENAGGRAVVKPCLDAASRSRLCVQIDENAGKMKGSYYVIAR
jgi:hypothetical protein